MFADIRVVGNFTSTLAVQVSDEEAISQTTLENTIKETVRQIGARIVDERRISLSKQRVEMTREAVLVQYSSA